MTENSNPQPRLEQHEKPTIKAHEKIQAKTQAPEGGKGAKQRMVKKIINGKVTEVPMKSYTAGEGMSLFMDAIGMSIPERKVWFKENPEYTASKKELGRRVNAVVEDGKPLDRRIVNKVRNAPGVATLGVIVAAVSTAASIWFGIEKYQDYQAEKGL